jgi:hypothetical protein
MNLKLLIILNIFLILNILLPWHIRGLYGFDWTDTTYSFQEALNILNDKKINKDFFSHIPGLSFILEAFFLKIFGISYQNHRNFGLIFPIIQYACLVLIISKILYYHNQKNYQLSSIFFSVTIMMSYWGMQLSWDNSSLAITFSFIISTLLFFLYNKVNKIYIFSIIFLITLILTLQIFTKQSHSVNIILVFFSILIISFLKKKNIHSIARILIVFSFFLFFNIFALSYFSGIDIPITLSRGNNLLDLKGLSINRPLEILFTILGVNSFKGLIFLIFFILSIFSFLFIIKKRNLELLLLFPLFILPFVTYYFSLIWVILHFTLIGFLFYKSYYFFKDIFYFKNLHGNKLIRNVLLVSSSPLLGSMIAEQLSWPGTAYLRPELLVSILIILTLTYFFSGNNKLFFNKKFFFSYLAIICITSAFIIETKPRRYNHRNVGLVKIESPESFRNWKVSKETFDTIQKLRSASINCSGNTLFQLSWMPISFEITSRINTIGYDLPYHDTISLKDGIKITKSLLEKPPDMLIVQNEYFDYKGPFPAKGMKYIFQNISKILEKYELREDLKDLDNTFKVYCLKKYTRYQ